MSLNFASSKRVKFLSFIILIFNNYRIMMIIFGIQEINQLIKK
jgi:hypothetical protein